MCGIQLKFKKKGTCFFALKKKQFEKKKQGKLLAVLYLF